MRSGPLNATLDYWNTCNGLPLGTRAGIILRKFSGLASGSNFPDYVLINLGPSYEQKGMHEQAIEEYLDAEARWGMPAEETTALRRTYASSGWRGYWDKRLELAKSEGKRKLVQAVFMAGLYSRLGQNDEALDWLERAYEQRDMSLILLNVDPSWKRLRSEPGFKDLLRRMRLEPRSNT